MKKNISMFGNDMPNDWNYTTLLSERGTKVKRTIIDASSDVAQVKIATSKLSEFADNIAENAHETAIVLADENLLIPMLSSLPENISDVNITMGYPLKQTRAYMFLKNIMDLQRNAEIFNGVTYFHHADVSNILKNTLVSAICESADSIIDEMKKANMVSAPEMFFKDDDTLSAIFLRPQEVAQYSSYLVNVLSAIATGASSSDDDSPEKNNSGLLNEQFYRTVLIINKLDAIIRNETIAFSQSTYMRLLDRMIRLQTIPFLGEPLSGIQIMGILETRSLDFKNLIILSVNEGIMPSVSSPASSYIPFSLREAFGLPSVNHQESIYAYHFFRLLHRAENIIFLYNSNSEGLRSGEISRFLTQMNFEPDLKPETLVLSPEIKSFNAIDEVINRTDEHKKKLLALYTGDEKKSALSPTAINMWLHCRMKFFYKYVCLLAEPDKLKTEIDPAMLGQILHEVMRKLYENCEGKTLDKGFLESLILQKQALRNEIERSVRKKLGFGAKDDGATLIANEALFSYILNILKADISYLPLEILNLETKISFPVDICLDNAPCRIMIGGIADRIDIHENTIRVVDYKTGQVAQSINSVSELFDDDRKKDPDGWLQTLLYCEALYNKSAAMKIRPSIYKIRKIGGTAHDDALFIKNDKTPFVVDNYSAVRDEFIAGLTDTINLIFSDDEPFTMTAKTDKCKYCAYKDLCMR